jgi:hypothetical protein
MCFSPDARAGRQTASAVLPKEQPQEDDMPLEINPGAEQKLVKAQALVDLDIPHPLDSNAICTCYAYPYPMAPPRRKLRQGNLTLNNLTIKRNIQATGYARRNMHQSFYPFGGWRWQNAYHRGVARSGRTEPHLLCNLFLFTNAVFPYVKEECELSNKAEEKRAQKYDDAVKEYTDERADAETDATRKGVGPVFVKFDKFDGHGGRRALVNLPPGQWWIVCTLKIPGLTYYWQEPLGVHEGTVDHTVLNEDSAMLIEGAW